ncbi:MAG: biotin--[acetyl-CoA-carboxylase] ligase [Oscillospiraceae bacterium]|nr:biotin--[acetyl-CoA-carboxylase] ligase [Oscillospiraceae bacterium]
MSPLAVPSVPAFNQHDFAQALASCLPAGQLQWFEQVDSTNNALKRYALTPAATPGQWYAAASLRQTSGRGRQGRSWVTMAGQSICCSLLYLPPQRVTDLSALTLVAGLACCQALQHTVEGLASLGLKWPNDLMLASKKLGGILCETGFSQGFVHHLVIGFGINVNQPAFPPDLADRACSLLAATGQATDPNILAAACAQSIMELTAQYLTGGSDFAPFRNAYKQHCMLLNQKVEVQTSANQLVSGWAADIAADGALIVESKSAAGRKTTHVIRCGEAHIGQLPET